MSLDGRDIPVALRGKGLQVGLPSTVQVISFSETATTSAAVASGAYCIRVLADKACHIDIASTPTATTAKLRLAAEVPEYFHIAGGDKVSVIRASENGTLNLTEIK